MQFARKFTIKNIRRKIRRIERRIYVNTWGERYSVPYTTHLPVLLSLSLLLKPRRILEFGSGDYSTLFFADRTYFPYMERLDSYENDRTWADNIRAKTKDDDRIQVFMVEGPMHLAIREIDLDYYDLIFVDDSVKISMRQKSIRNIAQSRTQAVIAIHDYERIRYAWEARRFDHRVRFNAFNPHVGIAWNGDTPTPELVQLAADVICRYADQISTLDTRAWLDVLRKTFQS